MVTPTERGAVVSDEMLTGESYRCAKCGTLIRGCSIHVDGNAYHEACVPNLPSVDWNDAASELLAQARARAREVYLAELRADGWLIVAPGCVGVPRNADEAVGMVLLGTNYLEQHAPERLRRA